MDKTPVYVLSAQTKVHQLNYSSISNSGFQLSVAKTKTKLITKPNQEKGKYLKGQYALKIKTSKLLDERGKRG